jgi:hypothetical protein
MNAAPIILLGFQRSGSTALAAVLQRGASAAGGLFTNNGKLLYYLRRWLGPEDIAARHFRCEEVIHALRRVRSYGQEPETDQWLAHAESALTSAAETIWHCDPSPHAHQDIARKIVADAYGSWPVWGEKYNEDMLDITYLEAILDRPHYLLLFRDPAQVARSMLGWSKEKHWNPTCRDLALAKWRHWNETALDALDRVDAARVVCLEYGPGICTPTTRFILAEFTGLPLDETHFSDFTPTNPLVPQPVDDRSLAVLRRLRLAQPPLFPRDNPDERRHLP